MNPKCENLQTVKNHVGRKAGSSFNPNGIYFFIMMVLVTIVLQTCVFNVQAKALVRAKKTLKLIQHPPSLIELRQKRDTVSNGQQGEEASDYYDDNYDVLPDISAASQPPTLEDQISEQAKQVAESFKQIWQSMADTVRHCVAALRAMFGEPLGDESLTPEQEQEILANLEAKYRLQQEHDEEFSRQAYGNQV